MNRTQWWGIRYVGAIDFRNRKSVSVTNTDFKNTNFSAFFCYNAPAGKTARIDALVNQTLPSTDPDLAYYNSRYSLLTEFKETPPVVTDMNQLNFVQQFDASVLGRLTDAEMALAQGDRVTTAQALSLANCPCLRSQNSKTVLDIYNRTLAAGLLELSQADSASLWNIATQDRKTGGRAVIQARNIIQSLADTMYVWETDEQTIANSASKTASTQNTIEEKLTQEILFSDNQNIILKTLNPDYVYQLIVYSLDGKVVLDKQLYNQTEASFSLNSGFYIARLNSANNNILTQKILIP